MYSKERGYGRAFLDAMMTSASAVTGGRVFYVCVQGAGNNYQDIAAILTRDDVGIDRLYGTITAALAATVAGRGDVVLIDPSITTPPTLTELATAATNGVQMMGVGNDTGARVTAYRAPAALPQSVAGNLFAVTAKIRLIEIIGEVTTVIQTQANNTKIQAVPTVGSAVDLCSVLSITAFAVGTIVNITGTLATAMQSNANGVLVGQAGSIIVPAGFIALNCAASNTGAIKWTVYYEPIDPGAVLIAQ